MRAELPTRRHQLVLPVAHEGQSYEVGFGIHPDTDAPCECFASGSTSMSFRLGSDADKLLTDACIAVSLLLASGHIFQDLCLRFGEDRAPGEDRGPPSSVLGAICAAGAFLEWCRATRAP